MAQTQSDGSPFAHGVAVFAGVMLIIGGGFQAIQALAAIVHDQYLVVLPDYIYAFDLTAWGWIHLLIGLGLAVIGIFVLRGQTWARVAGMVIAGISALLNFFWLPQAPWWALLLIAVDVLVIWALASWRPATQPQATRRAAA
jgi:hypothetical protein